MISNERPSPYGHRKFEHAHEHKTHFNEDTLKIEKVQIERKTFIFSLKENPKGRFLRITEDVGGHRDMIIIPASGLDDFKKVVELMAQISKEIPIRQPSEGTQQKSEAQQTEPPKPSQ
jgi:hypothetical protein